MISDDTDQDHVKNSPGGNTEECIPFPDMQNSNENNAPDLRQTEGSLYKGNISEAVHDEHGHNGIREIFPEKSDTGGHPALPEQQEGQDPQQQGDAGHNGDGGSGVSVKIHEASRSFQAVSEQPAAER